MCSLHQFSWSFFLFSASVLEQWAYALESGFFSIYQLSDFSDLVSPSLCEMTIKIHKVHRFNDKACYKSHYNTLSVRCKMIHWIVGIVVLIHVKVDSCYCYNYYYYLNCSSPHFSLSKPFTMIVKIHRSLTNSHLNKFKLSIL